MYLRFVILKKDQSSGKNQGIFQTLGHVRDDGLLFDYEIERANEIHDWFSKNLDKPSSFTRSKKPHSLNKAISWYKDTAKDHISKMREIVAILESHDVHVEIIQTEKPGYIVYEDAYQITAEPFNETGA